MLSSFTIAFDVLPIFNVVVVSCSTTYSDEELSEANFYFHIFSEAAEYSRCLSILFLFSTHFFQINSVSLSNFIHSSVYFFKG